MKHTLLKERTIIALLAAVLLALAPMMPVQAYMSGGAGSSRWVAVTGDNVTANQTIGTIMNNNATTTFTITAVNAMPWNKTVYVNYTIGGVAKSSGEINMTASETETAWVNYSAGEVATNTTGANITIDLTVNGTTVDTWWGTIEVANGTTYAMRSLQALIMALIPVIVALMVIAWILKLLFGGGGLLTMAEPKKVKKGKK